MTPEPGDAEKALREAIEAAVYWADDSKYGCTCSKCEAKRQSVIEPINRLARAAFEAGRDWESAKREDADSYVSTMPEKPDWLPKEPR